MSRLFISAAHKSSGKTTVSIGLCAALRQRGNTIQPFKKGPDYIDPYWLGQAAGRACYNLDFYTMQQDEMLSLIHARQQDVDITLIEGNKGLYDGLDLDGSNSNAALATLTRTPVILVLDARGMTRGIAPLILGYQAFDQRIQIAGVILNQLGGSRHESKLRNVIQHYTDVPVVGAIHRDSRFNIDERHLGLVPGHEDPFCDEKIALLAQAVEDQVDLGQLAGIARKAPALPSPADKTILGFPHKTSSSRPPIRLGIVRNAAFGFYYPDDLQAFEDNGATLCFIDPFVDSQLPEIDALFIGGGFPETHLAQLEQNHTLRASISRAIDAGLPAYAECGGLMYLCRSIQWHDEKRDMVGCLDADIVVETTPQGRGYVQLEETGHHPWRPRSTQRIYAHEFHYSRFTNINKNVQFAYKVKRGTGIDGKHDGYIYKNLIACYTHQRSTRNNRWTDRFLAFARQHLNRSS